MKTSYFFGWLAAVVLLAAACSDDKPAPAPDPQSLELKTVIDGKYWSSTESFIYEKNGEEIVDRKSSLAALHWDTDRRSLLGVFSFRTDDSSIDTYDLTPYDPSEESELLLYRGLYSLASDGKTVRLTANDPEIAQKNVYAGMTLQLRSIAEDCAEFDMEINDFVRQQWADIFEESPVAITKIRVTWRMLTDDQIAEYRNFQDPIVVFPNRGTDTSTVFGRRMDSRISRSCPTNSGHLLSISYPRPKQAIPRKEKTNQALFISTPYIVSR